MAVDSHKSGETVTFYDRRGDVVTPDTHSTIKPRRGVFALAVAIDDNAIMLSAEVCAPDVPELPGGGIEADDGSIDARVAEELVEVDVVGCRGGGMPENRFWRPPPTGWSSGFRERGVFCWPVPVGP